VQARPLSTDDCGRNGKDTLLKVLRRGHAIRAGWGQECRLEESHLDSNLLLMLWLCVKRIDQTVHICSIFHVHVSQGSVADRVALLRMASVRSPTAVGSFIFVKLMFVDPCIIV
jgi:hypothetical protein